MKIDKYLSVWTTVIFAVIYTCLMIVYQTNISEFKDVKNVYDAFEFMLNHGNKSIIVLICGILLYIIVVVFLGISCKLLFVSLPDVFSDERLLLKIVNIVLGIVLLIINLCCVKSFLWLIIAAVITAVITIVVIHAFVEQ